jgi:hypothetical protein
MHAAPPFLRAPGARALYQNLAHRSRSNADEVPLIVPWRARLGQTHIRFVDQRRGLQRLPRALTPHEGGGDASQLVVDKRRDILSLRRFFVGHHPELPAASFQLPVPSYDIPRLLVAGYW